MLDQKPLPVQTPTGQPYGQAGMQQAAQRAVPVAPQPVPMPGALAFDRPTERPGEPVTHGAPVGPGAGPEALGLPGDVRQDDLAALAPYLPALELIASLPESTASTRNFVRRLRGAAPTGP